MGFHSNNLVDLPQMSKYKGAIFSPINAEQDVMVTQIADALESRGPGFDTIFDPQLYVPATERGKLKEWGYFPNDVDTADISSMRWWGAINNKLAQSAGALNARAICSPVIIPKLFNDGFYVQSVNIAKDLGEKLKNRDVRLLQSVLVNAPALTDERRVFEIASLVTQTPCQQVYLIFVTDVEPRRELNLPDELLGAMRLIQLLEKAKLRVLVGFCSSDVLLWAAAGATDCASGKFFNLRRFTRERFEEPTGTGGGQLPYWFEEALLAFLREPDLLLVRKQGLLSEASANNPFGQEIVQLLDGAKKNGTKKPKWLGTSWRHFLYWFADVVDRLQSGTTSAETLLKISDANWAKLDKAHILPVERHNDGAWIRSWLNVLSSFNS
jgi:hypothetical protein